MSRNFGIVRSFFTLTASLCFLLCSLTTPSFATPPEKIEVRYSYPTQTLVVQITHESKRGNHFIKFVEITKNGSIVGIHTYDSQPTTNKFTYVYKIPALDDDMFEVTVTCSRGDSKKSSVYTVRQ